MKYPVVTTGIGILTADVLNAMFRDLERYDGWIAAVDKQARHHKPGVYDRFDAILLGYYALGGNRYKYAWVEAIWSNTGEVFIQKQGGMTSYTTFDEDNISSGSPFTTPAYHDMENGNNGLLYEGGINIEGDDYPVPEGNYGFYFQPVKGDDMENPTNYDPGTDGYWDVDLGPAVEIRIRRDDTGAPVYIFSAYNTHDGTCLE